MQKKVFNADELAQTHSLAGTISFHRKYSGLKEASEWELELLIKRMVEHG